MEQGLEMTKPGRPRSEETRRAILVAAGRLLFRKGVSSFTIEEVARLSGASKVTIYKWWPSRGALALDGFFSIVSPTIDVALTGDLAADLATQAESIVALFRDTRTGPVLAGLIAEAQSDPDLAEALRTRWLDPRRGSGSHRTARSKAEWRDSSGRRHHDGARSDLWGHLHPAAAWPCADARRHGDGDDSQPHDRHQNSVVANAPTTCP